MTSFATTWLNTTAQARAARLAAERTKREELYGRFIDQLAVLYADALQQEAVNYDKLFAVYALRGRISLLASALVFAAAEHAVKFVVDLNIGAPADRSGNAAPDGREELRRPHCVCVGSAARDRQFEITPSACISRVTR